MYTNQPKIRNQKLYNNLSRYLFFFSDIYTLELEFRIVVTDQITKNGLS